MKKCYMVRSITQDSGAGGGVVSWPTDDEKVMYILRGWVMEEITDHAQLELYKKFQGRVIKADNLILNWRS